MSEERIVHHEPTIPVFIARLNRLVWLAAGLISTGLAFRLLLKLINANPNSGFVDFIYSTTQVFVDPFMGIINSPELTNGGIISVASLFALVVVNIVAWAIVTLLRISFVEPGHTEIASTTS